MGDRVDELVRSIIDGNPDAEAEFCELLRPRLLETARKTLRLDGSSEPEDAVQDSLVRFLAYLRQRERFEGSAESYLTRMVRNRCIDFLRIEPARRHRPLDELKIADESHEHEMDSILATLTARRVLEGVEKLDPGCRRLIERIYFEDVPVKVISTEMGYKAVQGVYMKRDHCLKRLVLLLNIWRESRFADGGGSGSGKTRSSDRS